MGSWKKRTKEKWYSFSSVRKKEVPKALLSTEIAHWIDSVQNISQPKDPFPFQLIGQWNFFRPALSSNTTTTSTFYQVVRPRFVPWSIAEEKPMPWPINLKELDAIWNLGAQKISSISATSVPCQKPPFASYVRRNERSKEACFERKQRNFDSDRQSCLNTQHSTSPFIDIRTFLDPELYKEKMKFKYYIFIYIHLYLYYIRSYSFQCYSIEIKTLQWRQKLLVLLFSDAAFFYQILYVSFS